MTPAIEKARARIAAAGLGATVDGPLVPDSVFRQAAGGAYDAVVALYHDQGLIPLKLLHFDDGVNLTLGLPFVRTSPDHGTAYDIAGSGRARAQSFLAAFDLAARNDRVMMRPCASRSLLLAVVASCTAVQYDGPRLPRAQVARIGGDRARVKAIDGDPRRRQLHRDPSGRARGRGRAWTRRWPPSGRHRGDALDAEPDRLLQGLPRKVLHGEADGERPLRPQPLASRGLRPQGRGLRRAPVPRQDPQAGRARRPRPHPPGRRRRRSRIGPRMPGNRSGVTLTGSGRCARRRSASPACLAKTHSLRTRLAQAAISRSVSSAETASALRTWPSASTLNRKTTSFAASFLGAIWRRRATSTRQAITGPSVGVNSSSARPPRRSAGTAEVGPLGRRPAGGRATRCRCPTSAGRCPARSGWTTAARRRRFDRLSSTCHPAPSDRSPPVRLRHSRPGAPIITPRNTHRAVIVSLHQGKMPANRDFCDRGASTESVRYQRGKAPAGAMAKR